ncbi:MAG: four helix bundle protein [Terriglobales bacterium]
MRPRPTAGSKHSTTSGAPCSEPPARGRPRSSSDFVTLLSTFVLVSSFEFPVSSWQNGYLQAGGRNPGLAEGSAGEMRAQLYVAHDQSYVDRHQFDELIKDVDEVSKMINGLLGYLRRSGIKGTRFKR